ncbi:MAG: FHA domain-containing protein [Anaerolineales bacterium]
MAQERGAWLEGASGEFVGREFVLIQEETIVGRGEESHIQILDPKVSRKHAVIRFSAGGCVIDDLGSMGGTFVNGEIIQSAELMEGDTITIGETSFRFHYEPDIESAPTVLSGEDAIATVMASPEMFGKEEGESRCAQCGAVTRAEEKFCSECGAPLQGDAPAQTDPDVPAETSYAGDAPPASEPTRLASALPDVPHPAVTPPGPPPVPPPQAPSSTQSRGIPWKWIAIVGGGFVVLAISIAATLLAFGFFGEDEPESIAALPDPAEAQSTSILEPTEMIVPTAILTPLIPPTLTPTAEIVELPIPQPTVAPTPSGSTLGGASQITFVSNRGGRPQIYLINVDGSDEHQLTDLAAGACQPAWSPDGKQLAYTSPCIGNSEEYQGSSVFVMNVDPQGVTSEPSLLIATLGGGDYDPDWSYDGLRLAFTSWRTGRPQIFTIGVDGKGLRNVNDDLAFNWAPSWAPDGSQLAILTGRGGQEEIWLVPDDGGEEKRYTHSDGKAIARPDWSPDGVTILFEKVVGNIPRVIAAPVADGGVREIQVCQEGRISLQPMGEPTWSPDGQWIAFETWPDGVNHNIAIMRSSCTEYQELTTDPALDFDAAWRPEQ